MMWAALRTFLSIRNCKDPETNKLVQNVMQRGPLCEGFSVTACTSCWIDQSPAQAPSW